MFRRGAVRVVSLFLTISVCFWHHDLLASDREPSIYQIIAVEVRMDLPRSENGAEDPLKQGLREAVQSAFQRLMIRMLTVEDRKKHQSYLEELERKAGDLVSRTFVRKQKRFSKSMLLKVDVYFDATQVRRVLGAHAIHFNETPYPPRLLVSGSEEEAQLFTFLMKEARDNGITLRRPVGDTEDMAMLTWPQIFSEDDQLMMWSSHRYGVTGIWAVWVDFGAYAVTDPMMPTQYYLSGKLRVIEQNSGAVETVKIHLEGAYDGEKEARRCLLNRFVRKLLRPMARSWIETHAIMPEMEHVVRMKIVHGGALTHYGQFLKRLRTTPGVSSVRFVRLRPGETVLTFRYQGVDSSLNSHLIRMDAHVAQHADALVVTLDSF